MFAALAIGRFASKTITLFIHVVSYQRIDGACLVVVGIFGALYRSTENKPAQPNWAESRMRLGWRSGLNRLWYFERLAGLN